MNRDFKGIWIPREIWLNKKLSLQAKVLWAEIWSLHDRESGGCYASNDYLCDFMNMKISRLKEIMKELRDLGLLKEVSFDGRNRIIRAEMPEIEYGGQQTAGKPAPCQPENRTSDSRDSGNPTLYIEQSLVTTLDTPPIPPQNPDKGKAAEAADVSGNKSSKPKREKPDFSPKVREVANQLLNLLLKNCPVYRPPSDLTKFLTHVQDLIEKDKQDPELVIKTFDWAISDNEKRGDFSGWQGIIASNTKGGRATTPVEIFRKHFAKIHSQMCARPKRKFAASSDQNAAMEAMEEMNKRAL